MMRLRWTLLLLLEILIGLGRGRHRHLAVGVLLYYGGILARHRAIAHVLFVCRTATGSTGDASAAVRHSVRSSG